MRGLGFDAWNRERFPEKQMMQTPKAGLCFCYLVSKPLALTLLSRQEDKTNSYGAAGKFKILSGQNDLVSVEGSGPGCARALLHGILRQGMDFGVSEADDQSWSWQEPTSEE